MDALGLINFAILVALGIAAWLLRHWLIEQVKGSVRSEFDQALETLRGQIQERRSELEALRGGALSGILASQTATSDRRIRAVDDLWSAVCEWWTLNQTVGQISVLNLEEVSKRIENDTKLQKYMAESNASVPQDIRNLGLSADPARPYVSSHTWALYEAYKSIFIISIFFVTSFRNGIDPRPFVRLESTNALLKELLPETADVLLARGTAVYSELADLLRVRIVESLRSDLDGGSLDEGNVQRIGKVAQLIAMVHSDMEKARTKGTDNARTGKG